MWHLFRTIKGGKRALKDDKKRVTMMKKRENKEGRVFFFKPDFRKQNFVNFELLHETLWRATWFSEC